MTKLAMYFYDVSSKLARSNRGKKFNPFFFVFVFRYMALQK